MLLEKAFAKLHGGYQYLKGGSKHSFGASRFYKLVTGSLLPFLSVCDICKCGIWCRVCAGGESNWYEFDRGKHHPDDIWAIAQEYMQRNWSAEVSSVPARALIVHLLCVRLATVTTREDKPGSGETKVTEAVKAAGMKSRHARGSVVHSTRDVACRSGADARLQRAGCSERAARRRQARHSAAHPQPVVVTCCCLCTSCPRLIVFDLVRGRGEWCGDWSDGSKTWSTIAERCLCFPSAQPLQLRHGF